MSPIELCTAADWASMADATFPVAMDPHTVRDAAGNVVVLQPRVSLHHDVVVLGGDWVPVHRSGRVLVDQMVHTPRQFPKKFSQVARTADGLQCDLSKAKSVNIDVVLVGGTTNYYHWLVDYLPRLMLAARATDISSYRLLVNADLTAFQQESLAWLGFNEDQLYRMNASEMVQPRSVLIPTLLAGTTVVHPVVPSMLREAFVPSSPVAQRKIYLSRQEARSRRLVNESDLIALLSRRGFATHSPGAMNFREQVALLSSCAALVAVHGAGMTNVVFCPSGARVVEICSERYRASFFYMLSRVCGHAHKFVPAENVSVGAGGDPLGGDLRVDLSAVEAVLDTLSL